MRLPRFLAPADRRDGRHRVLRIAVASVGVLAGAAGLAAVGVRLLRRPRPLAGCVALVAGIDGSLGLALARELGRHGARLALIGANEALLDEARADLVERGMEVATRPCDLTSRRDVARAVDEVVMHYGQIDLVVNDGASSWGLVHATDAVLPAMRARKEGHIVNVATRYAAVGFSEGLEADLRPTGVRVTTVIAGQVEDGEAREAARRIVDAVQRGDRTITLGWQARLARLAHAVSAPLASTLLSDGTAAPA